MYSAAASHPFTSNVSSHYTTQSQGKCSDTRRCVCVCFCVCVCVCVCVCFCVCVCVCVCVGMCVGVGVGVYFAKCLTL